MAETNHNNAPANPAPAVTRAVYPSAEITIAAHQWQELLETALETYDTKGFDDPPGDADLYHEHLERAVMSTGGYPDDDEVVRHAENAVEGQLAWACEALWGLNRMQLAPVITDLRSRMSAAETYEIAETEAARVAQLHPE